MTIYTAYDIILSMNIEQLSVDDSDYDKRLDDLVDTGLYSYDDARRILGERPEPKVTDPEIRAELQAELEAIGYYEWHLEYRRLSESGSKNPEVRRLGGVKKCKSLAKDAIQAARTVYLHSKGVSSLVEPGVEASYEDIDDFHRGAKLWAGFRDDILIYDGTRGVYGKNLAKLL